jgi:hypothetical protein
MANGPRHNPRLPGASLPPKGTRNSPSSQLQNPSKQPRILPKHFVRDFRTKQKTAGKFNQRLIPLNQRQSFFTDEPKGNLNHDGFEAHQKPNRVFGIQIVFDPKHFGPDPRRTPETQFYPRNVW